ncbi:MAG: winged helix-turn-helix domain-containing protein [Cellvibrio sp.]|uniref:winged helix-turn-helix domain-containing protein n=1 Tax=Cellvibrio sp. TaxID=1965322 RepID=UPI0031A46DC9
MRWKIHHLVFCEKSQTLSNEGATIILEPLSVEVLAYFCRHPNVMISRDLLIAEVWNGRIVTDNAVTRVITKLRKALADTPETPRFIATFPKKGYKFVADVKLLDEHTENPIAIAHPTTAEKKSSNHLPATSLILGVFICCLLTWFWFSSPSSQPAAVSSYRIDALTRGMERTLHPRVSPDGRYLTYSTFNADKMRLHLKDLATEETVEIGDQNGWSGPAAWSDDGKQIAYLNTTGDACRYYLLNIDKLIITERKLIHNCPKGSYGKIIFSHENHKLIYTETPGPTQPFSIFELNTHTGDVRRLPQPELILGGNSQFDLHPTENKLLISSPNAQQWLEIYSLDLVSDALLHLFELKEYTCCAIWDHSGERVVIQGEHPAQELISFALDGKSKTTLFQVPHSVSSPARIPNSKSYAYVGGALNRDIYYYSFNEQTSKPIVDSAMDDWLPIISSDKNKLAFISDRSGSEEVWIREQGQSFERKLTNYQDGRHYFDLQWSPDGKLIAGMTINEIHVTDAANGNWRKLKIPQEELSGISWKDNQTLSFSIKSGELWQVKHYDLTNDQLTNAPGEWQFVRHATDNNDSLWIDRNDNTFYGEHHTPLALKPIKVLQNRRFNLLKSGDSVFYLSMEASASYVEQFNVTTHQNTQLFRTDTMNGLSVSNSGIYYAQLKNNLANIYRASKQ